MMTCQECLDQLHDYLDKEFTEDSLATLKAHLDACSPCLDRFEFSASLKSVIQKKAAREDVPASLLERIRGSVAEAAASPGPEPAAGESPFSLSPPPAVDAPVSHTPTPPVSSLPVRPRVRALSVSPFQNLLGLAASVAFAVVATALLVVGPGPGGDRSMANVVLPPAQVQAQLASEPHVAAFESTEEPRFMTALATDHEGCSQSVSSTDVLTEQETATRLSQGLGYSVTLPRWPTGMQVAAVRICTIDGQPVGHVILRRDGHLYSWFALRTRQFPGIEREVAEASEGCTVCRSTCLARVRGDETDCLVSDQPQAVLRQVALETGF